MSLNEVTNHTDKVLDSARGASFFTVSREVGYELLSKRFDAVFPWHVHTTLERLGAEGFMVNGSAGYILPTRIQDEMGAVVWYQGDKPDAWIEQKLRTGMPVTYFDIKRVREGFFGDTLHEEDGISIAHPGYREALVAQSLQKQIWNITQKEQVYPVHLYHPDSGLATRLVAKDTSGKVIGFLFGFFGEGEKQWMGDLSGALVPAVWLESQVAGVSAESRGQGVGKKLKVQQLEDARRQGIDLIRWTYDPLQVMNNRFNLGHLGAVVAYHRRAYYPFRGENDLNRVSASRFAAFWFPWADRTALFTKGQQTDLVQYEAIAGDSGTEVLHPVEGDRPMDVGLWVPQSDAILVEIPKDWTGLQRDDIDTAVVWRDTTDKIFEKTIGAQTGRYVVTQCLDDNENGIPYLLLRRSTRPRMNAILYGAVG